MVKRKTLTSPACKGFDKFISCMQKSSVQAPEIIYSWITTKYRIHFLLMTGISLYGMNIVRQDRYLIREQRSDIQESSAMDVLTPDAVGILNGTMKL